MRIFSWNVNGIRAAYRKDFLSWLDQEYPDILCVQETKAQPDQLTEEQRNPLDYRGYFCSAEKKGYSGVATFTRREPLSVTCGLGDTRFDGEGRVITTEFEGFTLLNIYFPNGQRSEDRLNYKLDFYAATQRHVDLLKKEGKRVIVCGDYNTAHKPIDLEYPDANVKNSGFMPVERRWLDQWVESGQVDIFREFCKEPKQYTWWDMRTGGRRNNVGWRIDYHFVSEDLKPHVKKAEIHPDVQGSDHCPVSIELSI